MTGTRKKGSLPGIANMMQQAAGPPAQAEEQRAPQAAPIPTPPPAPDKVASPFAFGGFPTPVTTASFGRRDSISMRVLPELREGLLRYLGALQAQGIKVAQHEVLECWLSRLQDPAYAERLTPVLLAARSRQGATSPRDSFGPRVWPHLLDLLNRYVGSLQAQGLKVQPRDVMEYWLGQLRDTEQMKAFTQELLAWRQTQNQ